MKTQNLDRSLLRFLISLSFIFAATGALSAQVSGMISYRDKVYSFSSQGAGFVKSSTRPARFIKLELRRSTDNLLLGSGNTDEFGNYRFPVQSIGEANVDLLLLAASDASPWTSVVVRDNDRSRQIQSVATGPYRFNTDVDFRIDYEVPVAHESTRIGGMFNIVDCILTAAEFVSPLVGERLHPCTVYWEDGSRDGTYSIPGSASINLLGGTSGSPNSGDDDSYDDTVIVHEYGHFVADLYSFDRSPGGSHSFRGNYEPTLSWSEGWATAFQCMARNNSLYWDATSGDEGGFNLDVENASINRVFAPELRGMTNEGAIACSVYDIFDDDLSEDDMTADFDDDPTAYGPEEIWAVFDQDFTAEVMSTFDDFYQGWEVRYPDLPIDAVLRDFGMEFVPHGPQETVFSRPDVNLLLKGSTGVNQADEIEIPQSNKGIIAPGGIQVWIAAINTGWRTPEIRLVHPDGTAVVLVQGGGTGTRDILEWFGHENFAAPSQPLSSFDNKPVSGKWTLEIESGNGESVDFELKDWRLKIRAEEPATRIFLLHGFGQVYELR